MIRIERPPASPESLQRNGERATREDNECYDRNRDDYRKGIRKFGFNRGVYGHRSVKNALLEAQRRKCCYCESKFRASSYGAVEHFRPKGAVRQHSNGELEYPGYYWLAYSWTNLLVVCYDPQTQSISACRRYSACSQPPRRRTCGATALREPRSRRPSAAHSVPRCGRCFCYAKRTGNRRWHWVT